MRLAFLSLSSLVKYTSGQTAAFGRLGFCLLHPLSGSALADGKIGKTGRASGQYGHGQAC